MKKRLLAVSLFLISLTGICADPLFQITPDRADALYKRGETANFTLRLDPKQENLADLKAHVSVSNDARDILYEGDLDFSNGQREFKISNKLDKPGFLRLILDTEQGGRKERFDSCAAYEPEKIRPAMEKPVDFDAFWADGMKELASIPPDFQRREICRNTENETFVISAATVNGKRIYGFLSIPVDKKKKYPVHLTLPSAGDGPNHPVFSKGDVIELSINIHDNPIGVPDKEFKENLQKVLAKKCRTNDPSKCLDGCRLTFYPWFGAEDKNLYYFRPVFLGISRLMDYAASLPEFDGKHFRVSGHSQGGGLSLVMTALRQDLVTSTFASVPGLCDHAGHNVGRETGWPWLIGAIQGDSRTDKRVDERRIQLNRELTGYYDACFFAERIRTPIAVVCGFIDRICVPSSVFAAYNSIPEGRKRIIHDINHGHAVSNEACDEAKAWLAEQDPD